MRVLNGEESIKPDDINTPFKILRLNTSTLQFWQDIRSPGLTAIPMQPIPLDLYSCHFITPCQCCLLAVPGNHNGCCKTLSGWLSRYFFQFQTGDAIYINKSPPAVLLLVIEQILLLDLANERAGVVDGTKPILVIVVTASTVTPVEKLRLLGE